MAIPPVCGFSHNEVAPSSLARLELRPCAARSQGG
jgi:hypothetical protein